MNDETVLYSLYYHIIEYYEKYVRQSYKLFQEMIHNISYSLYE